MRSSVAVCACAGIAALILSACAARDPIVSTSQATPSGNWRLERQIDRITGAPLASAFLMTPNASNSAVEFPRPAMLQLSCLKSEPVVRFGFEFKVGSNRNASLGYRFDEKPGRETDARFLQDYKTVVIEDKAELAQFVSELATSNVLYVRIRSLNFGRTAAEFRLAGAPAAIEAGFSGCELATGRTVKRTSARATDQAMD